MRVYFVVGYASPDSGTIDAISDVFESQEEAVKEYESMKKEGHEFGSLVMYYRNLIRMAPNE
jgi:hypothetical protein